MEVTFEIFVSIAVALGLAAACGFRVFVPLFVLAMAANAELLALHPDFAWIGSDAATLCFGFATALEVAGYYIPVVDNLLDTISTPAAAVAGAVVTLAVTTEMDPWLRWSLAVIAGGGVASAVQLPTVLVRGGSTGTTAGLANPVVSTAEMAGAGALSALAIFLPLLVPVALVGVAYLVYRGLAKRRREARSRDPFAADSSAEMVT